MTSEAQTKFRGDVLLQEYLRVCTDIRTIEGANDRVIGLGATFVVAAATVGLAQHVVPLFFALPFAIIGVIFYGVMSYVWVFSLGGYKLYLEEEINRTIGERLLLWEALVPKRNTLNIARGVLLSVYVLVSAGIICLSVIQVGSGYGALASGLLGGLSCALFVLMVASWGTMAAAVKLTYTAAVEEHQRPTEVSQLAASEQLLAKGELDEAPLRRFLKLLWRGL